MPNCSQQPAAGVRLQGLVPARCLSVHRGTHGVLCCCTAFQQRPASQRMLPRRLSCVDQTVALAKHLCHPRLYPVLHSYILPVCSLCRRPSYLQLHSQPGMLSYPSKALERRTPHEVCCTVTLWVAWHQVTVDKGVVKVCKITQPNPCIWLGRYDTLHKQDQKQEERGLHYAAAFVRCC